MFALAYVFVAIGVGGIDLLCPFMDNKNHYKAGFKTTSDHREKVLT